MPSQKVAHKHPALGALFGTIGAVLFGLNASTSKVMVQSGITPEQMVIFRSAATAILAAVCVAIINPKAFRVARSEWKYLITFGIIGVGLMQWAYTNAVANLQVGIALLIEYTAILIVPIVSMILFKEKVRKRVWLAVALVLAGLAIVANILDSSLSAIGVIFGFLAAAFLSVYFIMGEHAQRKRDAYSTMFYAFGIATVFWVIVAGWQAGKAVDLGSKLVLGGALGETAIATWMLLIWLGIFGSFVPMLLSFLALRHLTPTGAGLISTSETVFAFLFGWLWLQEKIDGLQMAGGLLVIIGIAVAQTARAKKEA